MLKSLGNVRHKHDGRRAKYAIETSTGKSKLLGVGLHKLDIAQPFLYCFAMRLGKHAFRKINANYFSGRPDALRRFESHKSGASGNVQDRKTRLELHPRNEQGSAAAVYLALIVSCAPPVKIRLCIH